MVILSNWRFDGDCLWGICQGHDKLADGTYIHTSQVVEFEPHEEYLDAHTYSGTHYRMQANEVFLDFLDETKEYLELANVNTSFLADAIEKVELLNKQKEADVEKILEENDLYLEFVGMYMKYGYFKKDGILHKLDCLCHVGMFQDSYLIRMPGVVDVRYFDKWCGIDFYHVSDGINNIHFKHVGEMPFGISGIGEGLHFTKEDTEIKTIKPENCKEGLFSPDCVNGKSMLFIPSDNEGIEPMPTMQEWYDSLSEEDKKEIDELLGDDEEYDEEEWYNSLSEEERKEIDDLVGKDDTESDFDKSELSWKILCHLTKWAFDTLLKSGVKLKVTIKDGDFGCSDVQDVFAKEGYLILYKSGDNYMMDSEQTDENILCVDDFEYICMIVEKYYRIME